MQTAQRLPIPATSLIALDGATSPTSRGGMPQPETKSPVSEIRELAPRMASAASQLVRALVDAGVDTFFGIPGGPVSPVFDALFSCPDATLVESRHETSAAFEAMGYYRATGKVPAVVVTAGPGVTNVVTGVAAAFTERIPMIVIAGDVAWAATGGRMAQDSGPEGLSIETMLGKITRKTVRASRPESLASQGLSALGAATAPLSSGPALLVVPMDIARKAVPRTSVFPPATRSLAAPPASAVRATARLLAEAKHPLVVIGEGARGHAAAMRKLCDVLNVPFVTTPQAKGLVSENHPRSLRNAGLAASWWARRYTAAGVDVCLVLGTDLDDSALAGTRPVASDGKLVHVDIDPAVFGRNFPTEHGITADVGAFADALYEIVTCEGVRNPHGAELMKAARAESTFDVPAFASDDSDVITPHRAIADLQAAAGPGARFASDIGEHMLFALHYLTATGPEAFTIHLGLGSMGSGIASSIGLAMGKPESLVVCVCGDGGMQMNGMELLVAKSRGLRVLYAVFNDARYNMVFHGFKQLYGHEAAWETPWVDFVAWAGSMGVPGETIEGPGQITPELVERLTRNGPAVLDIRIDRDVRIRGAGRNEALSHMSVRTI